MNKKDEQKGNHHGGDPKIDKHHLCDDELRFHALYEYSPNGILLADEQGRVLEFNETAHRQHGYTRTEFEKLSIADLNPYQSREEIQDIFNRALKKGWADFEVRHRTKEGEVRDIRVIMRALTLSGRKVFQIILDDITEQKHAVVTLNKYRADLEELVRERTIELAKLNEQLQKDIARRKRVEKKLRESEELFHRIFDKGPLGMVIFSPAYRILNANKALSDMMGFTEQEIQGCNILDVTHPDDRERSAALFRKLFSGAIPLFQQEKRCMKSDGEILWVNLTTTALCDEEGKVMYALCMIEDISNRKLAEQERENLVRELQEAMANIKILKGLLPTCAWCNRVRDDNGSWKKIETYIQEHSDASFTHGICPECLKKKDPGAYKEYMNKSV